MIPGYVHVSKYRHLEYTLNLGTISKYYDYPQEHRYSWSFSVTRIFTSTEMKRTLGEYCSCSQLTTFEWLTVTMAQQIEMRTTRNTTEMARESLWKPAYTPINWNKPPKITNSTSTDAIFRGVRAWCNSDDKERILPLYCSSR